MKLRICSDLAECEALWNQLWPVRNLFDCWMVRRSFQRGFGRPPHFIVAESKGQPVGLLPLSWIEEEDYYGFFPGETWQGKTWLEQNRIPALSVDIRQDLWEAAPENTWLRYLDDESSSSLADQTVDEVGYVFHPSGFKYDFEAYWAGFSGKSRKKIRQEVARLEAQGCRYHLDVFNDIEWMVETNLTNFGHLSYFHDPRFLKGFENLLSSLSQSQILRVVSVRIQGTLAAVDVGAVYRNRYTVLAGATNRQFPGIAKAINLFHLKWGCLSRVEQIDFLCGDFGWKARFQLHPRPLYRLSKTASDNLAEAWTDRSDSLVLS
jgi:Acetyltransferase (GNAT) domain